MTLIMVCCDLKTAITLKTGFTGYILDFFLNYTLGFLPNKEGVMVLLSLFKNGVLQDLYL